MQKAYMLEKSNLQGKICMGHVTFSRAEAFVIRPKTGAQTTCNMPTEQETAEYPAQITFLENCKLVSPLLGRVTKKNKIYALS